MRMLMIAALLPLAACQSNWEKEEQSAAPSGTGATRSYAATGFTSVELRGPDDVDVKQGNAFSVSAEGDPKTLDKLEIQVVNGALRVGRKQSSGWGSDHGARIHVVMPRLTRASLSGSGDLSIARAEGDFNGSLSGSGDLSIASLDAGNADFGLAGSGNVEVAGKANKFSASIAGSGDIKGEKLTAASADISIAGSGGVRAVVSGPASVSIVGSGDVELSGGAKCSVTAVGSGEARCS